MTDDLKETRDSAGDDATGGGSETEPDAFAASPWSGVPASDARFLGLSVAAGRPSFETLIRRASKLRCPRCGEGPLFTGWVKMPERCPHCAFRYERAPGYFLGSTYFNYGLTALSTTAIFLTGRLGLGISGDVLLPPLMAYTVLFPILLFRHARAFWLAMDCHFDPEVLADDAEQ